MSIESINKEDRVFNPSDEIIKNANVSGMKSYDALVNEFKNDYQGAWAELAKELLIWNKPFTKILNDEDAPFYKWFEDGKINASYNCLDRHLKTQPNKTAILFEADDGKVTSITYLDLYEKVCQFANGLKSLGLKIGDRVIIYLPMSIEAVVAMQACARLGLIHSVIFGGFSAKSIQERIEDTKAKLIITADGQYRGGKLIPLKSTVDQALVMGKCEYVDKIIIYNRANTKLNLNRNDVLWEDFILDMPKNCDPVFVGAEHPLFVLYTSGSTGKPKGVQHSTAGYLLHAMNTCRWTFDLQDTDIY